MLHVIKGIILAFVFNVSHIHNAFIFKGTSNMLDLHCHILPGIDDGSKNSEMSSVLLTEEQKQGVNAIVFTPHFNTLRISLEEFLKAREHSYKRLMELPAAKELGIKFKLGAEVYFSTRLNEMELDELCFTDTNYILIEFPTDEKPYGLTHTVVDIINRGYQPILAHVERYPYFTSDPTRLYDLVEKGCIVQINAGAIIQGNKIAMKYIKWGMAQLICTDCHDLEKRSPNLREAYSIVKKKFGEDYVDWFDRNARNVFLGKYVDMPQPKMPKKVMGIWI